MPRLSNRLVAAALGVLAATVPSTIPSKHFVRTSPICRSHADVHLSSARGPSLCGNASPRTSRTPTTAERARSAYHLACHRLFTLSAGLKGEPPFRLQDLRKHQF